jgi:hypothetical protein
MSARALQRRRQPAVRDEAAPASLSRHVLFVIACVLALAIAFFPRRGDAAAPPAGVVAAQKIDVHRGAGQGDALPVSVGIPFPPGALRDAKLVRIVDARGNEVPSSVTPMLAWHTATGGVRAVRVQFRAAPGAYYFQVGTPRAAQATGWPYAQGLVRDKLAAVATLTPEWLTASLIAGPQSVAARGEAYAGYVDEQFKWARELPVKDTTAWLFDRPSTLFKAYVRTGRADYLEAAETSYRWYMAGIKRDGSPSSPSCGGGWMPDGKPCDVKYVYIEPIVLAVALSGDDSMHDAATVAKMAGMWDSGGWNGPPGPYRHPKDYFTERLAGLGLIQTVAAFELTGEPRYRERIGDRIGWLEEQQRHNPDGLGDDGSWRNSWNVHENDPDAPGDVRGGSPWMSENIVDGLWHAWLVTRDPRIPPMIVDFGRYLERYGWITPAQILPQHDWRNPCSGGNGQIAWYWSSAHSDFATLSKIQDSEGWYSDGHTVELALPVAAAYYFEKDPAQAAALRKRFAAMSTSYAASCASISDTLRRFNWNNRGAGVAQWMMKQPPGAGLAGPANAAGAP